MESRITQLKLDHRNQLCRVICRNYVFLQKSKIMAHRFSLYSLKSSTFLRRGEIQMSYFKEGKLYVIGCRFCVIYFICAVCLLNSLELLE